MWTCKGAARFNDHTRQGAIAEPGTSSVLECCEDLVSVRPWHSELFLAGLLDHAGVDELVDEVGGDLAGLQVLLHPLHLVLHGVELGQLLLLLLLKLGSSFLLGLDLL